MGWGKHNRANYFFQMEGQVEVDILSYMILYTSRQATEWDPVMQQSDHVTPLATQRPGLKMQRHKFKSYKRII